VTEPLPEIIVDRLDYSYPGGRSVLQDVSFAVSAGERLAVIGPSGAGKSTLLLHLNGLLPQPLPAAAQARVHLGTVPVTAATIRSVRQRIGFVFQDPDDQLFAQTVFDDVAFGPLQLGCTAVEARRRVDDSLATVELSAAARAHPQQLSYGERKRVCLAGVLACQPDVLVLDEPSSNLDPRARRQLAALLLRLNHTAVLATHDLDLVLDVCHRVVVLDGGRVQSVGQPAQMLADPVLMDRHGLEVPWRLR
jgi:energy-coupling factor transporter ATP-binding protein EcfA2